MKKNLFESNRPLTARYFGVTAIASALLLTVLPARADDMNIITQGSGGSIGYMPPTLLFVMDNSGSMKDLPCENNDLLAAGAQCDNTANMVAVAAPNSSTVCANSALTNLYGPDINGDDVADHYQAPYGSDGVTYNTATPRYPIFDNRTDATYFTTGAVYRQTMTTEGKAQLQYTGTGVTERARIDSAISQQCATITDCAKRARCTHSFRTLGYYWEVGTSCGAGDPSGVCPVCGNGDQETGEDCDGADLGGATCSSRGFVGGTISCNVDCTFNETSCTKKNLGDACSAGSQCASGKCKSSVCSRCTNNDDCYGWSNDCVKPSGCSFYLCEDDPPCTCGNGSLDSGETCDTTQLDGETCVSQGFVAGALACNADCAYDYAGCYKNGLGTSCSGDSECQSNNCANNICSKCDSDWDCGGGSQHCTKPSGCPYYKCSFQSCDGYCGNAAIESPEVCDGTALNGETCISKGFASGTLACSSDCYSFATGLCNNCGNGIVNGGETCDGSNLNGKTCVTEGFASGSLTCNSNCLSFNTSACNPCGNNVINSGETCDGTALNSQTCVTQGFAPGTLTCNSNCLSYNTSACPTCGNNVINSGETCDGTNLNSKTCATQGFASGTLACNSNCLSFNTSGCTYCGNNLINAGETCDGTNLNGKTCVTQGFVSGTLACNAGCGSFNTSGCKKANGAACTGNPECASGKCYGNICSKCNTAPCTKAARCTLPGCSYYRCTSDGAKNQVCDGCGGGGLGGGGVVNLLAQAMPAATASTGPWFLGDWLNFYPPKGIGMIGAFKKVVRAMSGDARIGILTFSDISETTISWPTSPGCSSITDDCTDGTTATTCFNSYDSALLTFLDNLDFPNSTPASKALDWAGKEYAKSTGANIPICDASSTCGESQYNIVFLTDGMPNSEPSGASGLPYSYSKLTSISDGYYKYTGQDPHTWADDVAKLLALTDHRTLSGQQNVKTSVVSFGLADSAGDCVGVLQDVATAGQGECVVATDADALVFQLGQIVSHMTQRSVGFTSPSVSTTRVDASSVLSNASFRPTEDFSLWEGHVFGLKICDESLGTACTCPANTGANEVCVTDATGAAITYDSVGRMQTTPYWDAQLCLSGDYANNLAAINEDLANLTVANCYRTGADSSTTPPSRKILTAVERGGASNTLTSADQIDFTVANLSGQTFSTAYLTALNVGGDLTRGQKLVRFFRGLDASDIDSDGNATEDRNLNNIRDGSGVLLPGWWKLGEIFHSIPNTLERPTGKGVGSWGNTASYQAFASDNSSRAKVILAGGNDGMLHAFKAGTWSTSTGSYDEGTGEELWGFVSPELLPKLKDLCDPSAGKCNSPNHKYMVDGSVMVRDIWIGGTADKNVASNKSQWKTVAVYGHRGGGSTYVGLDVTNVTSPSLLWVFPQTATLDNSSNPVSSLMGESWLDVFPAQASIGPLRVQDSSGNVYDRWVVILSAGFDPIDAKGRALFILDAYTGDLVWMAQKSGSGATASMNYSFPASPVFYTMSTGSYPYIAGIVAPDHGGQIWHVPTPGPAVASAGRYSYTPEIVFKAMDPLIPTDSVGGDGDGVLDFAEYQSRPFFFAPTLTRKDGVVRIIIGSGDRDKMVPEPGMNSSIKTSVCTDSQRLYAIDLGVCPVTSGTGTRPCKESDLQEITKSGSTWTAATSAQRGWFFQLLGGEKVSTPFDILAGYAMYTTFRPTSACGSSSVECSVGLQGEAALYSRHFVTGTPLDWNGDATLTTAEERVSLGSGVPTAPAMSVAVSGGTATPTVFGGGSDTGLTTRTAAAMQFDLAVQIMRFPVSRNMCEALH